MGVALTVTVGAGVAVLVGTRVALATDLATFLLAALLLRRLRLPAPRPRERRPPVTAGLATIFANPTLAVLAPVTWIGLTVGALPETLALAAANRPERFGRSSPLGSESPSPGPPEGWADPRGRTGSAGRRCRHPSQ